MRNGAVARHILNVDRKLHMAYPTTLVAPNADGRLELFVAHVGVASREELWHRWQKAPYNTAPSDDWSGWDSPSICRYAANGHVACGFAALA
jgi:hypothetical protein